MPDYDPRWIILYAVFPLLLFGALSAQLWFASDGTTLAKLKLASATAAALLSGYLTFIYARLLF